MKFRTEISIKDVPQFLSPERLVLLAGSCFSDNIGAKLSAIGWPTIVNPCGVIYNPASMGKLFSIALLDQKERMEEIKSTVTVRDGQFVSWLMSSHAMDSSENNLIESVVASINRLAQGIRNADTIVLTFGTSDVWCLSESGMIVGNCHKHPASEFNRRRMEIDEITNLWSEIIDKIRKTNPTSKFIFTVSPRRYLADGFAENTRQKAVLILACERLCNQLDNVWYFPAYEILNDDLRDYRFYKADLLHPSDMAIDYIWEKFCSAFLSEKERQLLISMEKESRSKAHRPKR